MGDTSQLQARDTGWAICRDLASTMGPKTKWEDRRATMGKLYCLDDARRARQRSRHKKPTFFSRTELNQLLSLYSRRVSSGEWRDYAIDQRAGMAVFSVFRHTHDRPVFCIAKRSGLSGRKGEFLVYAGAERLKRADSIADALAVLDQKPRLVFSTSA